MRWKPTFNSGPCLITEDGEVRCDDRGTPAGLHDGVITRVYTTRWNASRRWRRVDWPVEPLEQAGRSTHSTHAGPVGGLDFECRPPRQGIEPMTSASDPDVMRRQTERHLDTIRGGGA